MFWIIQEFWAAIFSPQTLASFVYTRFSHMLRQIAHLLRASVSYQHVRKYCVLVARQVVRQLPSCERKPFVRWRYVTTTTKMPCHYPLSINTRIMDKHSCVVVTWRHRTPSCKCPIVRQDQWALYISGKRSSGHRVNPNMAARYVSFSHPTRSYPVYMHVT